MKKITKVRSAALGLLLGLSGFALAATFNLFSPATGILKGNSSSYVTTAAVSSDVISLWSGTCNSGTFLRADGSCQAVSAGATGANPTATLGLSAINGVAATFMRSDAAPALSQSIAPSWTANHIFQSNLITQLPGAAADTGKWSMLGEDDGGDSVLVFRSLTDANAPGFDWLRLKRNGVGPTDVQTIDFASSGDFFVTSPLFEVQSTNTNIVADQDILVASNSGGEIELNTGGAGTILLRGDGGVELDGQGGVTLQSGSFGVKAITNATERLEILNDGTWEVGGAAGSAGQVLTSNGSGSPPSWQAGGGGGPSPANPTASVGLTAVNGSASTYLRSDGAPALSQSIAPTWTGYHTFTATTGSYLGLIDGAAGSNAKNVLFRSGGGGFNISSATDAAPTTAVTNIMAAARSGSAWASLSLGNATNNPTFDFLGTGTTTFGAGKVVLNYGSSGSADPGLTISSTRPVINIWDTDVTDDRVVIQNNGGDFRIDALNAAGTTLNSAFTMTQTAGVVDSVALSGTAVTINGQTAAITRTGTFSATLSGLTGTPTIRYVKTGQTVCLNIPTHVNQTSSATLWSITNVPSSNPDLSASTTQVPGASPWAQDNSVVENAYASFTGTNNIQIANNGANGGFSNTGNSGWYAFTFCYIALFAN